MCLKHTPCKKGCYCLYLFILSERFHPPHSVSWVQRISELSGEHVGVLRDVTPALRTARLGGRRPGHAALSPGRAVELDALNSDLPSRRCFARFLFLLEASDVINMCIYIHCMCVCLTGHTYNCVLILYLIYNDYIQFNFVAIIYIMIMICFVYVATHAVS